MTVESMQLGTKPGKMSLKNDSKKKTTAAKRAEEIRSRATADAKIAPFTVINGDGDDWFYYHVPDGEQKARLEEKLTRLGYESAPGVKMAGIFGGSV